MLPSYENGEEGIEEKLKQKLRELFQFEDADLSFGIYKIMNYKRIEIEKFIEEGLISEIKKEFSVNYGANLEEKKKIEDELKELSSKNEIKLFLEAIQKGDKESEKQFRKNFSDLIIKYENLEKQYEMLRLSEDVVKQIYNYLINFFSRYYENGDFISKRRYGKREKYIIPYNGEEVILNWVNEGQYYIKTTKYFKSYSFKVKNLWVKFKIVNAEEEKGNVKSHDKKVFLLNDKVFDFNKDNRELTIYLEYRALRDEEKERFWGQRVQDKINSWIISELERKIPKDSLPRLIFEREKDENEDGEKKGKGKEKGKEKSIIEKHLYKYTRRNTSDYFIHSNLKEFLERELEFYIKNELLQLDDLKILEEPTYFDKMRDYLVRIKVFRKIALKIIEFLSEIENFQVRLWKKKKFIINTHYVITLDKIKEYAGDKFLEELIEEILNKNNTQQLAEWEQLFGVKVKKKSDLWQNDAPQETKWKKLTIDTRYFDDRFKWKLLEALTEKFDLDEIIDGILIKSENWQALNLLLEKYYEKIKLIYIDPPYNTGSDEFLYKDNYQHSSWLTMMENRLRLAQRLLAEGRSIYVSIDDNELDKLKMLLEKFFKFQRIITWDTASLNVAGFKVQKQSWIRASDYILYFSKGDNSLFKMQYTPRSKEFIKKHYKYKDDKGIYRITRRGNKIYKGEDPGEPLTTVWKDILSFNYVAAAADEGLGFSTQKPQALLKRIIESSSDENEVVLDFFAGSGTTLVAAHKLKRKYIGIEMADYFDRILIPRMKKVLFGEQSGISKKVNWRGGGFFKYHTLEQYEDSIENIEFKSGHKALYDFTDYFIKYMLEWETKDSRTFLNIGELLNPFNYKIKILENYQEKAVNVDLIETFNYLLGLKVIKYKIIRQKDSKRNYIFVFGKKENTKIAIVWRNINDINFEKDREIIESTIQKFQPDEIYINRDALVEGFRPIEPQFKALMFKEIF